MKRNKKIGPLGIITLVLAIAYIIMPYDFDTAWYGYIDDFFVFMAGYIFFNADRNISTKIKRLLYVISGSFFILGMMTLIILTLFS